MKPVTLSINPSYLCNFRCKFCYLTPEQLGDPKTVDLVRIGQMLDEVTQHTTIKHIDLYGGELVALPEQYLYDLHQAIRAYYHGKINVITNMSRVSKYFLEPDVQVSVSFDFNCRERHEQVYRNMATFPKPIHVLVLASKCLINSDVDYMIMMLNQLQNVKTVEIKPYSTNQANQQDVTHKQFEEFVKRWLTSKIDHRFTFTNRQLLDRVLKRDYNAFSDDHVYITPTGKFAVLDFDQYDDEMFVEMDHFTDYIVWTDKEKKLITSNPICSQCPYLGHCLTEHYRWVRNLDNSCNGYRGLIEWYERVEN